MQLRSVWSNACNAHGSRRIGLGITGLADTLVMLGLDYASNQARTTAADALRLICHTAYRASRHRIAACSSASRTDERLPSALGIMIGRPPRKNGSRGIRGAKIDTNDGHARILAALPRHQ
jgi:hypothetical protein